MKKQVTAVEWFAHAIIDAMDESFFRTLSMDKQREMKGIYEKAKAMEKLQITEAYTDGWVNRHRGKVDKGDDYYNEIYGGKNE
jgi:hypothetical protein